jgi:hypothetical protein
VYEEFDGSKSSDGLLDDGMDVSCGVRDRAKEYLSLSSMDVVKSERINSIPT